MSVIIGAGISGLSAGHYLLKKNLHPQAIIEASSRVGGWIETNIHQGFLFESGPRTIRPRGPPGQNTLELLEDLGLADKVNPIKSDHVAVKNRMIYANEQLCLLPSSLSGIFKILPPFSKPLVFAGFKDLFNGTAKKLDDESIYDFTKRRFGRELADYAISSMICGICAGDAKEISVKFLMKDIFDKEQKYGSVLKGLAMATMEKEKIATVASSTSLLAQRAKTEKWSIYSLEGGLEVLPKTLALSLKQRKVVIPTQTKCTRISFAKDKIEIETDKGNYLSNHLISSIPSNQLSKLVAAQHPKLAHELNGIPIVDVAVINLEYDSPTLIQNTGFGFLVPPKENLPILGVIYDSCCFDMPGHTVLTVMMGGKWFRERFGENPKSEDLLKIAKENVAKILKITVEPNNYKVNILRSCIPQYVVGHHARVERIRKYIKDNRLPIALCGSSYDGVGVNDVILSARRAVDAV